MADTTVGFNMDSCVEHAAPVDPAWLLEGLRDGRDNAYEALVSRYQQPVYNLVYRLMDDPGDASDVVQEVFLKVFRNVGSFRGNSSLKTWIYRIAVNEAHNHRRWFARHRRRKWVSRVKRKASGPSRMCFAIPAGRHMISPRAARLA